MIAKVFRAVYNAAAGHKEVFLVLLFLLARYMILNATTSPADATETPQAAVVSDPPPADFATLRFVENSDFVRRFSLKDNSESFFNTGDSTHGVVPRPNFGGRVGQHAESVHIKRGATSDVTRCSTTVFALTNYLCGEDVALRSMMLGASGGFGVGTFEDILNEIHINHLRTNATERHVFRLGLTHLSSKHHIGISHVWVVLFHEDGTFSWLQSFVGHYSLKQFMKKGGTRLSYAGLVHRLQQVKKLTVQQEWSDSLYKSLFDVAPVAEELNRRLDSYDIGSHQETKPFRDSFSHDPVAYDPVLHKLELYWDEACITEKVGDEDVFHPWWYKAYQLIVQWIS